MAKFKVGDKVRTNRGIGQVVYVDDCDPIVPYLVFNENWLEPYGYLAFNKGWSDFEKYRGHLIWCGEMEAQPVEPCREFIVIRRDGAKTIAELRHDREVIKSGTAICNASDTFDFDTGAKIAFDRLMGREEPKRESLADVFAEFEKPEPKPAHKFKVGDRVKTPKGTGTVVFVDDEPDEEKLLSYLVQGDKEWNTEVYVAFSSVHDVKDGKGKYWFEADDLSPAPAPEPPKFYTGKVFAEKSDDSLFTSRDGRIFEFVDGECVNSIPKDLMYCNREFKTIDEIRKQYSSTIWHEVKSDV